MSFVSGINTDKQSLAFRRFVNVLSIWERDKEDQGYHWLYICARCKGEKLRSLWISPSENIFDYVENKLNDVFTSATSFEIEALFSPEVRTINRTSKNQWNSMRGKLAVVIKCCERTSRWAAVEMVAKNLRFSSVVDRHISQLSSANNTQQKLSVTLYQTKQWFCDNTKSTDGSESPVEMFRGNELVEIGSVDQDRVATCAKSMASWLVAQVSEGGAANYKYWPSRGVYASSNNAIRQWMASVCLSRAARAFNNLQINQVASKNLEFNIKNTYRNNREHGYIWMNGTAKLGAAALAALAIIESTERKEYLNKEYALFELINSLSNTDGSFNTFYIPRERLDNQNFYSGEALLFLATRFSVSRRDAELDKIMKAFLYYRQWHRDNRNPAFVPWHTQAYYIVWRVTRFNPLKEFIFEMNDWLLSMQQWDKAEYPDMQGRFYDPGRPHFGPPHASSTGVYLEGLIDAYSLAKESNDVERTQNYRSAIVRGIRSLIQLQFKDSVDCFYVKHVDRVLGGLRTTVYDNTIRLDNVQHGLMALMKVLARFDVEDYAAENHLFSPISQEKNDVINSEIGLESAPRVGLWMSDEFHNASISKKVYNFSEWTAVSVVSRSVKPQQRCLYFAKEDLTKELEYLGKLDIEPSAIVTNSDNAKALAIKTSCPVYEVIDPLETARELADAARRRTRSKIIGITGSVGKTSIKDALASVLAKQGLTHETKANANDGWGVLDTLMNMPRKTQYSVMELGMLGTGSIKIKSKRVKPHIGIITNIHDAHLAYHGDVASIAKTKSDLFDGLVSGGVGIIPRDSSWYDFLNQKAKKVGVNRMLSFGCHPDSDFRLLQTSTRDSENIIIADVLGETIKFRVGAAGQHWGLNAMSILAAVYAVGASVEDAVNDMEIIRPSFRRGEVHQIQPSHKQITIIDDTWNASPASVSAAIHNLDLIESGNGRRKVLILGDMLQLGSNEIKKHIELKEVIITNKVDKVITVGSLTKKLFDELPRSLRGLHFSNAVLASKSALNYIENGDVVLIKGSNAMEMWRVVRAIRKDASELSGSSNKYKNTANKQAAI